MKNCVYRFLDENRNLLYIGKAKNLKNRISGHDHLPKECYRKRRYIEYVEFKTIEDMNIAERFLIATYKPPYNTEFKNNNVTLRILELMDIDWKPYDPQKEKQLSEVTSELHDGVFLVQILNGEPTVMCEMSNTTINIKDHKSEANNKNNVVNRTNKYNKLLAFDSLLLASLDLMFKYTPSASIIQRYFSVGYERASRIFQQLKSLNVINSDNELLFDDISMARKHIVVEIKSKCDIESDDLVWEYMEDSDSVTLEYYDEYDELIIDAIKVVIEDNPSASTLQRRLNVGFNRAAKIIDQLEILGIVGEPQGFKVRKLLINDIDVAMDKLQTRIKQFS